MYHLTIFCDDFQNKENYLKFHKDRTTFSLTKAASITAVKILEVNYATLPSKRIHEQSRHTPRWDGGAKELMWGKNKYLSI